MAYDMDELELIIKNSR